jgi:hypothetical protein
MGHDVIWCKEHNDYEMYPDGCIGCNDCGHHTIVPEVKELNKVGSNLIWCKERKGYISNKKTCEMCTKCEYGVQKVEAQPERDMYRNIIAEDLYEGLGDRLNEDSIEFLIDALVNRSYPKETAEKVDTSKFSTWYFTFGVGQTNSGKVQPIKAQDSEQARTKMFDVYGKEWCWQYSQEDWNSIKRDVPEYHTEELETLIAEPTLKCTAYYLNIPGRRECEVGHYFNVPINSTLKVIQKLGFKAIDGKPMTKLEIRFNPALEEK